KFRSRFSLRRNLALIPRSQQVFYSLGDFTRGMATRPGPLEVVTTEPASNIDDFADEKESGYSPRLHRFRGEFARAHAANRAFCFRITLRFLRLNRPGVKKMGKVLEFLVAHLGERLW